METKLKKINTVKYAASNCNPGFCKFNNGKVVLVRDENGNFTKEFLHESFQQSKAKGGFQLPK